MSESVNVQYGQLVRIAIVLGLIVLVGILVFQNREPVETNILLTTILMPRAALIFTTFSIGLLTGMLSTWAMFSRRKRNQAK